MYSKYDNMKLKSQLSKVTENRRQEQGRSKKQKEEGNQEQKLCKGKYYTHVLFVFVIANGKTNKIKRKENTLPR